MVAKMLAAGKILYSEVFNHHGPLIFVSGLVLELAGNYGIAAHRIPVMLLQWVALGSIFASPLLRPIHKTPYFILSAAVLTLYLPLIYGHMYLYQTVAGLFCVIILSQFVLPLILRPSLVKPLPVAAGAFLISCLPFLAITYLPVAALFLLASCRRATLQQTLIWAAIGTSINLLVLAYIGSYAGYLADHIYLNSQILPFYNDTPNFLAMVKLVFSYFLFKQNSILILLESGVVAAFLYKDPSNKSWRSICIIVAVGSFLMRGNETHAIPFYYSMLALPMVILTYRPAANFSVSIILLVLASACVYKLSAPLDVDPKTAKRRIPDRSEFSDLAKKLTNKDDKIIVYSFANTEYILSDRMPASGNFFLLPMQVKYNENPKFGVKIDSCHDIKTYRPKLMFIDKLKLWDKYDWSTYGECVDKIIGSDYVQVPNKPFYVRRDIAASHPAEFKSLN